MHAKNYILDSINDHPLITTAAIACGTAVAASSGYTRVAYGMLGMAIPVCCYLTISGTKSAISDVTQPIFQGLNASDTHILNDSSKKIEITQNDNAGLFFSDLPKEITNLILFNTNYPSLKELSCTNRYFASEIFSGSLAWEAMFDRVNFGKFEPNLCKSLRPLKPDYKKMTQDSLWKLSKSDLRILEMVELNCYSVKDDSIIRNFMKAFNLMQKGQSENFVQIPNTHYGREIEKENDSFSNALDFLKNCIKEDSKLKNLVNEYLKNDLKIYTFMGFIDGEYQCVGKTWGLKLGEDLNQLLIKTENFLNVYT